MEGIAVAFLRPTVELTFSRQFLEVAPVITVVHEHDLAAGSFRQCHQFLYRRVYTARKELAVMEDDLEIEHPVEVHDKFGIKSCIRGVQNPVVDDDPTTPGAILPGAGAIWKMQCSWHLDIDRANVRLVGVSRVVAQLFWSVCVPEIGETQWFSL